MPERSERHGTGVCLCARASLGTCPPPTRLSAGSRIVTEPPPRSTCRLRLPDASWRHWEVYASDAVGSFSPWMALSVALPSSLHRWEYGDAIGSPP